MEEEDTANWPFFSLLYPPSDNLKAPEASTSGFRKGPAISRIKVGLGHLPLAVFFNGDSNNQYDLKLASTGC